MLRVLRKTALINRNKCLTIFIRKQSFLTNNYKCEESWHSQSTVSPILCKINLNDFYNKVDQNYSSKGVISAIDVDIFAHAVNDPIHLDELRDLLHKLRLSAETGNMLESTHQATIRNYLKFGDVQELLTILKDPLNFGIFLDDFTANILLDKLIESSEFEQAANVSSLIMLQEECNNIITMALCQYACFKYIFNYTKTPEPEVVVEDKKKKVEEIKIRVKFLRNPYFDDHFDIKDVYTLSGKTLAWLSEKATDNLNNNLQIIGWCIYKKYDKLMNLCQNLAKQSSFKVYKEVLKLLENNLVDATDDCKATLDKCILILNQIKHVEVSLEESLKINIENAINQSQSKDIQKQLELFQQFVQIREQKLEEQTKRLDRAKRIEIIEKQQKELNIKEQKLWFFDNEDKIDLEIEDKQKNVEINSSKKKTIKTVDEDYIPPEILPKRK